jgi:hypothetical protein
MKKFYLSIFLLVAVVFTFHFIYQNKNDRRGNYEQFLLEKAAAFSTTENSGNTAAPDHPGMAAFQEYVMTVDPVLGYVPKERLWNSYQQTLKAEQEEKALRDDPILEWQGTGANMGGRTRALMFDPNDESHKKVWAGGVTGGLWYNDNIYDNNSPWQLVDDFWPGLSISSLYADPNEPMTFYAGTEIIF